MRKNDALKKARIKSGLSQDDLAEKLGVNQAYVAALEKNKNFSVKKAMELAQHLKIDWRDIMIFEDEEGDKKVINNNLFSTVDKGVPYYDGDVTGSIVGSFLDVPETPAFFVDFKPFNDCDAYFTISGDSMYPKYQAGEILAVKQVRNFDMIQWGESYLIIGDSSTDNIRTVKNIHPNDRDDSKVIMRASNPNFKGDTPLKKEAILSMYIIKGKIKKEQL